MSLYNPFIINAIIGVILCGITSMIIGTLSMLRNVHYLSAEVTHSALSGAGIGALIYAIIGYEPIIFIMATLFSIATSIVTGYIIREKGVEASGLAIGTSLAISMSIYSIVAGMIRAELLIKVNSYLISDILLITSSDLMKMSIISIIGLIVLLVFYREIIYICFDIEGSEALGLNTKIYDYLIFTLIGASGVVLARAVGALLVYALTIIPAACAIELSNSIRNTFIYTFTISILSGIMGLIISIIINLHTSGMIALTSTTIYIIIKTLKKFKQ
ncbi:MAG: metal ABC transporter permease [Candidatus Methanomethylicia archaeon]